MPEDDLIDLEDDEEFEAADEEPEVASDIDNLFGESLAAVPIEPDWIAVWAKNEDLAEIAEDLKAELYPAWAAHKSARWRYSYAAKPEKETAWKESERLRQEVLNLCEPWLSGARYDVWEDLCHGWESSFVSASSLPFCGSLHGREATVWRRIAEGGSVPAEVLDEFPMVRDRDRYGHERTEWKSGQKRPDADVNFTIWRTPTGFFYSPGAGIITKRGNESQGHGSYGGLRGQAGERYFDEGDAEPFATAEEAKRAALLECVKQLEECIVEAEIDQVKTKALEHAKQARAWCEEQLGEAIPQQMDLAYPEERRLFLTARRAGYDDHAHMLRCLAGEDKKHRYAGVEDDDESEPVELPDAPKQTKSLPQREQLSLF